MPTTAIATAPVSLSDQRAAITWALRHLRLVLPSLTYKKLIPQSEVDGVLAGLQGADRTLELIQSREDEVRALLMRRRGT
jgi:hypothetical protein